MNILQHAVQVDKVTLTPNPIPKGPSGTYSASLSGIFVNGEFREINQKTIRDIRVGSTIYFKIKVTYNGNYLGNAYSNQCYTATPNATEPISGLRFFKIPEVTTQSMSNLITNPKQEHNPPC